MPSTAGESNIQTNGEWLFLSPELVTRFFLTFQNVYENLCASAGIAERSPGPAFRRGNASRTARKGAVLMNLNRFKWESGLFFDNYAAELCRRKWWARVRGCVRIRPGRDSVGGRLREPTRAPGLRHAAGPSFRENPRQTRAEPVTNPSRSQGRPEQTRAKLVLGSGLLGSARVCSGKN